MSHWLAKAGVENPEMLTGVGEKRTDPSPIAAFVKPLRVVNNRKWFGGADVRLDIMVVHGGDAAGDLYKPTTLRYRNVEKQTDLVTERNGIPLFFGEPKRFLMVAFMLSRDTKDSDDLAKLLVRRAADPSLTEPIGTLAGLATLPSELAIAKVGFNAATALADLAYEIIRSVSPTCLGMFHGFWLEGLHNMGVGRHPKSPELYRRDDIEYGVDIYREKRKGQKG